MYGSLPAGMTGLPSRVPVPPARADFCPLCLLGALLPLFSGQAFDLTSRLSTTLMMMAVAVTFSPALPVLFPMVSVYLVFAYFGDKFFLLRLCHIPPQVRQPITG